jgi:hypothetical protein
MKWHEHAQKDDTLYRYTSHVRKLRRHKMARARAGFKWARVAHSAPRRGAGGSRGRERTLAQVTGLVAIAELARLVDARGGARGHNGAEGADVSGQVDLHRWVSA